MKKTLVVISASLATILLLILAVALIISFKVVKTASDSVNTKLLSHFSKLIRIPETIARQNRTFDETVMHWEMETLEREVVGVNLRYNPGFSKNQDKIEVFLEVEENGDVSLFNKVLPALVIDKQSLTSALDPQKADLSANPEVGYSSIKLSIKPQTSQTARIMWEFDKSKLSEISEQYAKLAKYPEPLIKVLLILPKLTFRVLGAN